MLQVKNIIKMLFPIIAAIALTTAASAASKGHINVDSKAHKLVSYVDQSGKKQNKLLPASKVLPGEIVQYSTNFTNISKKPADNISITNPIPKHTTYLANTAEGKNCNIVYSIDGGKNWAKPEQLKIKNSEGKLVTAKASDYTHIRWVYQGDLEPEEKKTVSFRVKLN